MRVALKSYVFFVPVDEGVYFRAGQRTFVLKGKGVYPIVVRLLNAMDGSRPLEAIEAQLPANVQPVLRLLVQELTRNQMLQQVPSGDSEVSERDWQTYGDTLKFLRDTTAEFETAFRRWRRIPTYVCGAGYALKALARSLARSGVARLELCFDASCKRPSIDEITQALAEHRETDPEFTFDQVPDLPQGWEDTGENVRILYAADSLNLANPSSLASRLATSGRARLLMAGALDGVGFVGPDGSTGGARPIDLWQRLTTDDARAPISLTTASIVGNMLVLEAMKSEAGIRDRWGTVGRFLHNSFLQVSAGGDVTRRDVFPRRRSGADLTRAPTGEPPSEFAPARSPAEIRRVELAPLFDPFTGVLSRNEAEQKQIPLPHHEIGVRLQRDHPATVRRVVSWGMTPEDAEGRAILLAVGAYLSLLERADGSRNDEPIVVEYDRDRWQLLALARGIVWSRLFVEQSRVVRVMPEHVVEPSHRGLLRVAKLYTEGPPVLSVRFVPGLAACLAAVRFGEVRAFGVAADPVSALAESLGLANSLLRDDAPFDESRFRAPDAPPIDDWSQPIPEMDPCDFPPPSRTVGDFGYEAREAPCDGDPLITAMGLHAGRMIVTRIRSARA